MYFQSEVINLTQYLEISVLSFLNPEVFKDHTFSSVLFEGFFLFNGAVGNHCMSQYHRRFCCPMLESSLRASIHVCWLVNGSSFSVQ